MKRTLVGPAAREKIIGLGRIILTLKESPKRSDYIAQEHYEKVENGLTELIQKM